MHFNGVEIVAPLVGIIGGDAIAGDRARHAQHGVAVCVEIQRYRRCSGAGRPWRLKDAVQRIEIIFNGAAFIGGQRTRGRTGESV
ncbi:hypothetical protein D3C87_1953830 [compost metagenome]